MCRAVRGAARRAALHLLLLDAVEAAALHPANRINHFKLATASPRRTPP